MIPTRLQATPLTDGKVSKFTMKENVQLSPVTDIREHIGTKKTFLAGGTIDGVPVKGKVYGLKKGGWAFMQSGVGIVVDSPEGVYIVPFSKVETHSSVDGKGVVDTVTDEAKEAVSDFREEAKDFNPKKVLGFTYKQLLVIAVVGLLISRSKK